MIVRKEHVQFDTRFALCAEVFRNLIAMSCKFVESQACSDAGHSVVEVPFEQNRAATKHTSVAMSKNYKRSNTNVKRMLVWHERYVVFKRDLHQLLSESRNKSSQRECFVRLCLLLSQDRRSVRARRGQSIGPLTICSANASQEVLVFKQSHRAFALQGLSLKALQSNPLEKDLLPPFVLLVFD